MSASTVGDNFKILYLHWAMMRSETFRMMKDNTDYAFNTWTLFKDTTENTLVSVVIS